MQRAVTEDPSEAAWFGRDNAQEDHDLAARSPAALLARTEGLRSPPVVAAQILAQCQEPNTAFVDLRVTLEQDPAICSQLVRMANTAAFATRIRCASVDEAVMRLGTSRVRSVAAGLVALGAFERESAETTAIRRHSARVAAIAEVLGREQRGLSGSDMFLCGLVHDIGKLAFVESDTLDYARAPEGALCTAGASHGWEHAEAGFDHASLGAAVLEAWLFPAWLTRVVELHHDPAAALQEDTSVAAGVTALRLADQIEHAITSGEAEPWRRLAQGAECAAFGISEDVLEALWVKIAHAIEDVGSVFD